MNDTSWAIKAVEAAAMKRARAEAEAEIARSFRAGGDGRIFGLSIKQIGALVIFYNEATGKDASEICEP